MLNCYSQVKTCKKIATCGFTLKKNYCDPSEWILTIQNDLRSYIINGVLCIGLPNEQCITGRIKDHTPIIVETTNDVPSHNFGAISIEYY